MLIPDLEFARLVLMDLSEWNWNMFEFCSGFDEFEVEGFTPLLNGYDFLVQRGWVKNPLSEGTTDERFAAWTDRNPEDPLWKVFNEKWVEFFPPRYTLDPSDQPTKTGDGMIYYGTDEFTLGKFYCDEATKGGGSSSVILLALALSAAVAMPLLLRP